MPQPAAGEAEETAVVELERVLTRVARAMLRLEVPRDALREGEALDRSEYWLLVRVSECGPRRLSDIADSAGLDISTVSRQVRNLVESGLVTKVPDPDDGRAALLSLSPRGMAVLESFSAARRRILGEALDDWTPAQRGALAEALARLADVLVHRSARAAAQRARAGEPGALGGSAAGGDQGDLQGQAKRGSANERRTTTK